MIGHVSVVVPAADEQDRIAACLSAVQAAARQLRRTAVSVGVVVVLDACRDQTAKVVASFPGVRVVRSRARCVGAARGLGSAAAIPRSRPLDTVWMAHTDADSRVPRDWLSQMVAEADRGHDLVLGTVRPDRELSRERRDSWRARHLLGDGHSHVHGANLGIRASTLHALGGWRPLVTGEDVDLVARAQFAGARIRRSGSLTVCTSGRIAARAPGGFAAYLRGLATPGARPES